MAQSSYIQYPEVYGKEVIRKALPAPDYFIDKGHITTLNEDQRPRVVITDAQIDGCIGRNCVVEIEAGGKKKYRAAIMDLWLHRHPKKLLIIMTAGQLGSKSDRKDLWGIAERTWRECTEIFKELGFNEGDYRVVVLDGHRFQGSEPSEILKLDVEKVQKALQELSVDLNG